MQTHLAIVFVLSASGCATSAISASRGATRAQYQGGTQVIVTNAAPTPLCELRMSFDDEPEYGDNWLPSGGLASGASLELHVRPGTYKAMWSTCKSSAADPYFAATLWRDSAIEVTSETQLYAYVADTVSPTTRAKVLGRDYSIVRFQGQPIASVASVAARPARPVDAFAAAERSLAATSGQAAPERDTMRFEAMDASEYLDPTLVASAKVARTTAATTKPATKNAGKTKAAPTAASKVATTKPATKNPAQTKAAPTRTSPDRDRDRTRASLALRTR